MAGEPVPGAEILVEQEPNDVPISLGQSNNDGEFTFTFPKGMKIPDKGVFKITVTPPSKLKGSLKKKCLEWKNKSSKFRSERKMAQNLNMLLLGMKT